MMIGKHKKFRAGILAMLATSTLICSSTPVAQGIISKEEHEQLVKDGKFDFRNNYDEASQNLAKMKCEDRIEGWGSINDGKNSYAPSDVMWVRPTKEEMKSFTEVSWSDPGDYEYLVDTFPEGKRPKLMKATTTGRYFIQSTIPNWDPDKPKEEYYRQFKPEHYLPKEYAENVPVKIIKEDGKPVSAIVDDEIQNPDFYINRKMEDVKVDPKSGIYKIVAKPEFYIGQEATIAERIAYFSKHPEIYEIYDVSDVDSIPRDKSDLDRTRRILGSSPDMLWHSIPGVGWGAYDDEGNEIGESCLFPLVIKKPSTIDGNIGLPTREPGNGAVGSFLNLTAYYPAGVGFTIGPPRGTYTFAKVNDKGEYLSGSEWEITFDSFGLKIYVGDNKRDIDGDSISTVPEDKRGIDSDGWSETERGYGFDKEGRIWIPDANDEPGVVSISHYSIAEVFDMLRNRLSFYGGVVPPSSYELEEMKDMFTIKEHKAPNGYLKTNDAKRSFFMSSIGGKHLMVNTLGSFTNIKPGMLHFKKVDENGNPLPGSTWKIVHTKSGKEYIVEDDSSGNPFKGDLVEELGKDILANPGDIDIPLPPGTYTVQELKAPEGYKLDPTVHTAVLDPENSGDGGVYEDFLGTITNTPEKPTEEPTPSPSDSPEPSPSESPEPSPSESPEPSLSPSDTPTPTTQETTPEGSTTPEIPPTTPSVPEVSTTPQTPVETTETTPPVVTTPEEPEETPETTPSSPVPPTTVKVTEVTTKEHPPIKVTETEREQVPPTPTTVVEKETEKVVVPEHLPGNTYVQEKTETQVIPQPVAQPYPVQVAGPVVHTGGKVEAPSLWERIKQFLRF